ncbi:MAG: CHAD domain-containing protein [Pseudomonadota bacterium]|nr:CHAD domain-containing protein [Pseudomonadota bacterium]
MGQEIELKFELKSEHVALLHNLPILAPAPARTVPQLTVYYDSPKGNVRRHGFSLRVRSADGGFVQTVKPLDSGAALFAREEWEGKVGSIEPDEDALVYTPLSDLVRAGRLKKLVPVIRSEVHRTSWRLTHNASAIAVDLDEGSMVADGSSDSFTELELELLEGTQADLLEAARAIADHIPVRIGVLTKAERGFALADGSLGKVTKAAPVAVRPEMSVADGLTIVIQSCLTHFRRNEPIVVTRRQPEALHQTRVGMRRLRSAFSLFKPVAADEEYEALRQELRWFTNLLGDARNLDVYLQRDDLEERPVELIQRREEAYDTIVDALNSARFLKLMFDLVAWLATGQWRSAKKAQRPLLPFAGKRLDRMWGRIVGVGDLASMDDSARHQLRIEVKKLRYGVEFFRALYPAAAATHKQFADAVEELQEVLGQLNDIVTAQLFAAQTAEVDEVPGPAVAPDPVEQLVTQSEQCLARLRAIGPYWTAAA